MVHQPRTVWAVAFACVIAFMGIGLVDPILKPIADDLSATPSQVSLLFTSYNAVMAVAMLFAGWVSSRLGAKTTLLMGLAIIIVGAGAAGMQDAISGIVAFRAVWGLGNAMFIATALTTIVTAAKGSVGQAIILYEAALGLGIAAGPLLGGVLGGMSWRFPFFGVSVLMTIALVATALVLPSAPPTGERTSVTAPLRALGHRGLLTVGLTAFLYNFGFFTLLAFTPFPLDMDAHGVGLVFFGWGLLLALSSVLLAPLVHRWVGTAVGLVSALALFMLVLLVMGLFTDHKVVLVVGVVLAGAALGVNNTLITETVMKISPAPRGVASSAYSFVRFIGGAIAPWLAGRLGERSVHVPFFVGAGAVLLAMAVLWTARDLIHALDHAPHHGAEPIDSEFEARAVSVGDA
ncbi:MFS transporter [Aestuariimicrobium sp. T2.26MG-19.2B]|uniref:MFS transporter n=1 Tax=Aestuariimicrobium sp. T2.26MG-19.2B TaxID=3040679 RepID=UPI002477785C|nr:MFS transporter [Aestuariimicrobium sp. T2.26MG-19.2B]CAI9409121.1 Multidrug efflux protein YfmO [Aestuariimicrobium sp. T2.26MG-19.2B]